VVRPYAAAGVTGGGFGELGLNLGQRVAHPKFGEGVVLNAEGQGPAARVQVNFEAVGAKWLVLAYANLQPV
jgi:DNA helicase-2/ATP-dependent DNA helicase PcrA